MKSKDILKLLFDFENRVNLNYFKLNRNFYSINDKQMKI